MTEAKEYIEPLSEGVYDAIMTKVSSRVSYYRKTEIITIKFFVDHPTEEHSIYMHLYVTKAAIIWWGPLLRAHNTAAGFANIDRFESTEQVLGIIRLFVARKINVRIEVRHCFPHEFRPLKGLVFLEGKLLPPETPNDKS